MNIESLFERIRNLFSGKDQQTFIRANARIGFEIGMALVKCIHRIIEKMVITDHTTGWTRIHEKVKSETLRFFNQDWIHWKWIHGNNRSCLK